LAALFFALIVQASQSQPWERKHEQLQQQHDAAYSLMSEVHATLLSRVQKQDPELSELISLDPPKRRATGYRLLPEIREDAPRIAMMPVETLYSLRWLEGRLDGELKEIAFLKESLRKEAELDYLVSLFNDSWKRLRSLENHLGYHAKWQEAIRQYPAYFRDKNNLIVMTRAMKLLMDNGVPPEQIADLRQHLLGKIAPFKPTRGLQLFHDDDGEMTLPVTVCTDIEDSQFLSTFKTAVREVFSQSPAALEYRFSIALKWRIIRPEVLYGGNAPSRGAQINVAAHYALFVDCPLVITTGASSLNARVGERIFLSTEPVSRRTLAHEFGHLLGFEDAYLRGYDGNLEDIYGVTIVEWSGLSPDLMGDSDGGQVSSEMIETLIGAYGNPVAN
jgi:hypothetical protein